MTNEELKIRARKMLSLISDIVTVLTIPPAAFTFIRMAFKTDAGINKIANFVVYGSASLLLVVALALIVYVMRVPRSEREHGKFGIFLINSFGVLAVVEVLAIYAYAFWAGA